MAFPFRKPEKLKASSLTFTLMVMLLIGMMLSSILLLLSLNRKIQDQEYFKDLAQENLLSGVRIALHPEPKNNESFDGQIGENNVDSFLVEKEEWGLFGLLHATGIHGRYREKAVALTGEMPGPEFFRSSLFVFGKNKSITLCGKASIKGKYFIPLSGFTTYSGGSLDFTGSLPQPSGRNTSKDLKPSLNYERLSMLKNLMQDLRDNQFKGESTMFSQQLDSFAWDEPAHYFSSPQEIFLDDSKIKGKAIFISPQIRIGKSAQLENVILIGRKIVLESGFTGSLQCFATDSIVTGLSVKLQYPSVIALFPFQESSLLMLGDSTELQGLLVQDASFWQDSRSEKPYCLVADNCKILGQVYVDENLDFRGSCKGNVSTRNFILKSGGSVHDQYILNGNFNSERLSEKFLSGCIYPSAAKQGVVKWMN